MSYAEQGPVITTHFACVTSKTSSSQLHHKNKLRNPKIKQIDQIKSISISRSHNSQQRKCTGTLQKDNKIQNI